MKKCKTCNKGLRKWYDDYQNQAFKVPFINLVVWRFDFICNECIKKGEGK